VTALTTTPTTRFERPVQAFAAEPAEQRGLPRDGVRLLVATPGGLRHSRFRDLPDHLRPGDLVVVNDSATVPGEVDGVRTAGRRTADPVVVHVGARLDDGSHVVELRTAPHAAEPVLDATPGETVDLRGESTLTLLEPYPHAGSSPTGAGDRLWRAAVDGEPVARLLARHGRPIAYGYLRQRFPLESYQTVFSLRPGSAEMPSAARPFTPELVTRLVTSGVGVVPVTLHTGFSSQEAGEAPQPEWFEVPAATAAAVLAARSSGGRVVAVGTTVTRALESAVGGDGVLRPARGWTTRVVTPDDPPCVVTGLVSGWHDPQASHLLLVEAVAGADLAQRAYGAAVDGGYLWHEFGDSGLFLP
jgi:S-adenosylmethionine:tRNA ribosyltransferase-isomerase